LRGAVPRVTLARHLHPPPEDLAVPKQALQPAVTLDDDPRDYLTILTEPFPCQECRHAARCKASLEACAAFSLYVAPAGEPRWRAAPRVPTRALFETIFAEPQPAKARTPKHLRLLTVEERRQRNTLRKQRWRQDQRQARDAAA
jgi:hypothetical protein